MDANISPTSRRDTEGLHSIANTADASRAADVVFVHGLAGKSHDTWTSHDSATSRAFFWPEELGKDVPQCGVWTLGYPAGITIFGSPGTPVWKRAGNLAQKLANAGLGDRPILFIVHSMGGLVVKYLVVGSVLNPDQDRVSIASQVKGIVFCATPHRGSEYSTALEVLRDVLPSQAHVKEMRLNAEEIDEMHTQFIEWHRRADIPVLTYAESHGPRVRKWYGRLAQLPLVVPRASANPGIAGAALRDVDADHFSIVKPAGRHEDIYVGVLSFVRERLRTLEEERAQPARLRTPGSVVPGAHPSTALLGSRPPRLAPSTEDEAPTWLSTVQLPISVRPTGLAVAGNSIFVVDHAAGEVLRVEAGVVIAKAGGLAKPHHLIVFGERLVVADSDHHRLTLFDLQLRPVDGMPEVDRYGLRRPHGLTTNVPGEFYVTDSDNHRVVQVNGSKPVRAAGTPTPGPGPGEFSVPCGIAASLDCVFVADTYNHRIQILGSDLRFISSFGEIGHGEGQMAYPVAVATWHHWIVISDEHNKRLQLWRRESQSLPFHITCLLTDVLGDRLGSPFGICFDEHGDLFVADRQRGCVQRIDFRRMLAERVPQGNRP